MGKVAIVTGASRGLGRGIALTLAKEAGYTVYATARNKDALEKLSKDANNNSLNGVVYPYVLDQEDDVAVEKFVEFVASKHQAISLLVNSSYGGLVAIAPHFGKPFWERPISVYDKAMDIGVRSSYVMSKYVVPIMVEQKNGLIVQTSSTGAHHYAFDVAYGVAHAGIDRLAADMALELKDHNVKALTLHPVGGCETEILSFPGGESTIFVGRAVVALADKGTDTDMNLYNGKVVITAELSAKYGFGHDDDPEGEMKTRKISEAKAQRSFMDRTQFHNQLDTTLEEYDAAPELPFKLSDLNSEAVGAMFENAKKFE